MISERLNFNFAKNPGLKKNLLFLCISILSFAIYFFAAKVGLHFADVNRQVSPLWPASGMALVIILLFGVEYSFTIFIAAALANYQTGLPLSASLAFGLGNMLEAVLAIGIYQYATSKRLEISAYNRIILAILAVVVSTAVAASVGAASLWALDLVTPDLIFHNWVTWYMGDIIGILFIAPFGIRKLYEVQSGAGILVKKYLQVIVLLLIAFFASYFVFTQPRGGGFLFIVYVPLVLAAIWSESFAICTISLLVCAVAIISTTSDSGPFAVSSLNDSFVHLQLFLLGLGVTSAGLISLRQEGLHRRALMALSFGWLLSGFTFYSVFNSNYEVDQNRFISQVGQAQEALKAQFNIFITMVDSGVGFFNASDAVSQKDWQVFTKQLMSNTNFASVEGLGVAFPKEIKNSERTAFIITYIEPYKKKRDLIGLNLSREAYRYEAAIRARDTGLPSVTNVIRLKQDKQARAAVILFSPFYKKGHAIGTIQERRKAFLGLVYAPILIENFVKPAFDKYSDQIHLTMTFDSSSDVEAAVFLAPAMTIDVDNKIVIKSELAGQPVSYIWHKSKNFQSTSSFSFSLISFFGAVIALLLAIMLSTLENLTFTAQELADRKTKEVIEKNRVWKTLTETAPVGIFMTDSAGACTYTNSMWSKMTGITAEEALGQGWMRSLHPDDRQHVLDQWSALLFNGKAFNTEYRFQHSDSTIVFSSSRAVPLLNEKKEVSGYLGTIQDITETVKRNNALLASSRLSSLGEMAGGIAHEINNPLSIILGKAVLIGNAIKAGKLDVDKALKSITQITDTTYRIAKIIRGLRSFARDTTAEPFEKCSLAEVFEDTLELCHERFLGHSVRLILPDQIDPQLYFWGRPEQLAQVILNLLNNGFDAALASSEKWVEVNMSSSADKIRIEVTDSGAGISPQLAEKIFEPFFTSKVVGQGTGLGLSIAKGIMETHSGALYLDQSSLRTKFVIEIGRYFLTETIQKDL